VFCDGSVEHDKKQNNALRNVGFQVVQLVFPKTSIRDFRQWFKKLNYVLPKPICVLGRSSGEYLAKEAYEMSKHSNAQLDISCAIYLAPVFNPHLRANLIPTMKEKTIAFFNDAPINTSLPLDVNKELMFLASEDANVPTQCFTPKQLKQACYLGIKTHSGMCTTSSNKFVSLVTSYLEKNANAISKPQF
jgi:hypothetical protein